jgi:IS5 family transposase
MKPRLKPQDSGTEELFRSKLKNIINLRHELVRLGELIDWARLEAHFAPYYKEAGRPGLAIRLVVGLHLLSPEGLSDEAVCARWERDPYMQYFGGGIFSTRVSLERSGYDTLKSRGRRGAERCYRRHWRWRIARGRDVRTTEAVAVTQRCGKASRIRPNTVCCWRRLSSWAGGEKAGLFAASYVRVARRLAMKTGRYLHAKQKKRAASVEISARLRYDPRVRRRLGFLLYRTQ